MSNPKMLALALALMAAAGAQEKSAGAGPVIVLETVKGTVEFETYPEEAPKTRVLDLMQALKQSLEGAPAEEKEKPAKRRKVAGKR